MKPAILACVFAAALFAQRDPFAGMFQGDQIALELKASGGKYTGTLTVQGQAFPATASASGASANGTFTVGGRNYPFSLAPFGNGYKLTSEGSEYLMARKVESPPPPEPAPPAPTAPPPARVPPPAPASPARVPDEPPAPAGAFPSSPPQSIVGFWRNPQGYAQFNADGTGTMDGQSGRYEIHGDQLTLIGAQGQITLAFAVRGDQLTLKGAGGSIVLDRSKPETGAGSVHMELVGKWCWVSQVNATNGGARQSNRCITLNGNGSYQYYGMTDSYNPYGGATSQSNDSGTWTATDTTLTTRSANGRSTTYRLEKRNHPKNVRDPMIVLNGEPFVTAYNKPPW
jgi:hypothetical protein